MTPLTAYIKAHWAGEHPLWQAYWINVFALAHAYAFASTAFIAAADSLLLAAFFLVGMLPLTFWSLVGAWRSATVYARSHEAPRNYLAGLAYIALLVHWAAFVSSFVTLGGST